MSQTLPPGQRERSDFPRFGLTAFARRFPQQTQRRELQIGGAVGHPQTLSDALDGLPRHEQCSDFHCVTGWSSRDLRWGGVRFLDFYREKLLPQVVPATDCAVLLLRGQDGARTSLLLSDALAPTVLLADQLNGEPLSIAHGAPLRLVVPGHYGYKSVKYLQSIMFHPDDSAFRPNAFRFMDHPRARVAQEERGRGLPGWLLRYLYRPLIGPTVASFAKTLREYRTESD